MNDRLYIGINLLVLSIVGILFITNYLPTVLSPNISLEPIQVMLIIITVILVNAIKAFRMYFILLGHPISRIEFLKQYCKTVPVSIVLPFKSGDLFKAYCFSNKLKSYFYGFGVVLVDRFFDTLALTTLIFITGYLSGATFGWIHITLVTFLVLILAIYLLLPSICHHWKEYLIKSPATESSLKILSAVSSINIGCSRSKEMLKGKWSIITALSVLAWIIELGSLSLARILPGGEIAEITQVEYLSAALGLTSTYYQHLFVVITVMLLICMYTYVRFKSIKKRGED